MAQLGSADDRIVVEAVRSLPPFFVGHWIELRSVDGSLLGIHRIAELDAETAIIRLESDSSPAAAAGVLWQAIYRFDAMDVEALGGLSSGDPIRVEGDGTP